MHIWGLGCNHHLVTKTAEVPEGIKHISDSAWRRKHTPTGEGGGGAVTRVLLLADLKMLNVSAVASF